MVFDWIYKWQQRVLHGINMIRVRLLVFNNIHLNGRENIHFTTQIYGRAGGTVSIGKGVSSLRDCSFVSVGGQLDIKDFTSFSEDCIVVCHERIAIGEHCLFGPRVCIYDHDHKYDKEGVQKGYKTAPIIIGERCWIGANAIILRGTTIGEGSIVGAGTIVKGVIPPHTLVTNNRELCIIPIE